MKEKTIIFTRGIPGCGKSTFAEYLALSNGAVICTADDYFIDENGDYKWNPDKIGTAHRWCESKAKKAMEDGKDVIIANTSTKESELKPYITMADEYGYRIISLIVENRHGGKNIHDVPEETINKMKDRFSIKL
jgi:predicted kinase